MESLYILIPLSVVLVFVIGMLFWWSLRNGQYDDLEGPAYRLLMDDKDELPDERCNAATEGQTRTDGKIEKTDSNQGH
ncbi:cbb3-type cytochrome oxidase assembly protein CcoS [Parazoarcus communis]|uniref:Cbb3-type cytochrome oxidase assembly protein CcoS n=1 Tax=Parazoarcus communis TaxID=41977 RepID=A0A2U8GNT3_9RHOO|nr:cbb3-type cytochrome oxidase assembly protein CcoS [Parazoarcus communis]AWI74165.1 cbb3-type cytochrome oxidase assembly protein CcoS [Parazoarcus communis]